MNRTETIKLFAADGTLLVAVPTRSKAKRFSMRGAANQRYLDLLLAATPKAATATITMPKIDKPDEDFGYAFGIAKNGRSTMTGYVGSSI